MKQNIEATIYKVTCEYDIDEDLLFASYQSAEDYYREECKEWGDDFDDLESQGLIRITEATLMFEGDEALLEFKE